MKAVGIPYVRVELEGRKGFCTCPHCKLRVQLTRKDRESFSNIQFALHWDQCPARLKGSAS